MIGQLVDFIKVSISQHLGKVNWILLHDAIIFIVHLGKTLDGAKDWVHVGKKELIDTFKLIQILRQREILIRSSVVTSYVGNGDGCFVFSSPWTRTYLLKNFDFNFIAIVIDWWAEHELAAQVKLESDFYKKGGEKNWTKNIFCSLVIIGLRSFVRCTREGKKCYYWLCNITLSLWDTFCNENMRWT